MLGTSPDTAPRTPHSHSARGVVELSHLSGARHCGIVGRDGADKRENGENWENWENWPPQQTLKLGFWGGMGGGAAIGEKWSQKEMKE